MTRKMNPDGDEHQSSTPKQASKGTRGEWLKRLADDPRFVKAKGSGTGFIILGYKPSPLGGAAVPRPKRKTSPAG
jgi:hypothetical protein